MKKFLQILLTLAPILSFTQTDSLIAKPDSSFSEGIYLTNSDYRHNLAVSKDSISVKKNNDSKDIYTRLKNNSTLTYISKGKTKTILINEIWGYIENKKLYINKKGTFYLVNYVGSIFIFSAMSHETVISITPVTYRPGNLSNTDPTRTSFSGGNFARPYLISYYNGKVLNGTWKKLGRLLKPDPELYQEYKNSESEDLGKMKSLVKRYNEKHPMYILK